MRLVFSMWFLGFALLAAQKAPAPEVVPVDKEPMHKLVFENEYVRVFEVEVPPGGETKYHRHERDYVGVILGSADVESERVGEAAVGMKLKDGEARFTQGGFAHKAVNKGDKPFRNVTVELKFEIADRDAQASVGAGGVAAVLHGGPELSYSVPIDRSQLQVAQVRALRTKPFNPQKAGYLRQKGQLGSLIIPFEELEVVTGSAKRTVRAGEVSWASSGAEIVIKDLGRGLRYTILVVFEGT